MPAYWIDIYHTIKYNGKLNAEEVRFERVYARNEEEAKSKVQLGKAYKRVFPNLVIEVSEESIKNCELTQ
jgi:hypothetical protein